MVPDGAIDPGVANAVRLRALGLPYTEIAKRLGRDWETVKRWVVGHPELLTQTLREVSPEDLVGPLVPKAVDRLNTIIEDPETPAAVALNAANSILDRAKGKTPITQRLDVRAAVVIQVLDGFAEPAQVIDLPDSPTADR